MSKYIGRCDKCGQPFKGRPRRKMSMMKEICVGRFSVDGFSRYYCAACADEAEKALRRWEMEE